MLPRVIWTERAHRGDGNPEENSVHLTGTQRPNSVQRSQSWHGKTDKPYIIKKRYRVEGSRKFDQNAKSPRGIPLFEYAPVNLAHTLRHAYSPSHVIDLNGNGEHRSREDKTRECSEKENKHRKAQTNGESNELARRVESDDRFVRQRLGQVLAFERKVDDRVSKDMERPAAEDQDSQRRGRPAENGFESAALAGQDITSKQPAPETPMSCSAKEHKEELTSVPVIRSDPRGQNVNSPSSDNSKTTRGIGEYDGSCEIKPPSSTLKPKQANDDMRPLDQLKEVENRRVRTGNGYFNAREHQRLHSASLDSGEKHNSQSRPFGSRPIPFYHSRSAYSKEDVYIYAPEDTHDPCLSFSASPKQYKSSRLANATPSHSVPDTQQRSASSNRTIHSHGPPSGTIGSKRNKPDQHNAGRKPSVSKHSETTATSWERRTVRTANTGRPAEKNDPSQAKQRTDADRSRTHHGQTQEGKARETKPAGTDMDKAALAEFSQTERPKYTPRTGRPETKQQDDTYKTHSRQQDDTYKTHSRQQDDTHKTHSRQQDDTHKTHSRQQDDTHKTHSRQQDDTHKTHSRQQDDTYKTHSRQDDTYKTHSRQQDDTYKTHSRQQDDTYKTHSRQQDDTYKLHSRQQDDTYKTHSRQQDDTYKTHSRQQDEKTGTATGPDGRTTWAQAVDRGDRRTGPDGRTTWAQAVDRGDRRKRPRSRPHRPSAEKPRVGFNRTSVSDLTEEMRRYVREKYPALQTRLYFVPPIHFNVARRKELPDLNGVYVPAETPESSSRADETRERLIEVLKEVLKDRKAFVLSGIIFEDYLNKRLPVASAQLGKPMPVPLPKSADLPPQYRRGEAEILIIDKARGILIVDIKAVGDTFGEIRVSEAEAAELVRRVLDKAMTLMMKSRDVLLHLVSDIPVTIPVSVVLVLPNLKKAALKRTLDTHPALKEALEQCLTTRGSLTEACLCAEDLPSKHQAPTEDDIRRLTDWWDRHYPNGPQIIEDDVYETIIGRFCGPFSTITVWTPHVPRTEVRTLGQAVNETGNRFATLLLLPQQKQILDSPERCVYLTGPPGSGKTLVLVLKGVQWARSGCHVCVLSAKAGPSPIALVIQAQMHKILEQYGDSTDRTHVVTDTILRDHDGLRTDGSSLARRLRARTEGRPLSLILDELQGEVIPYVDELRRQMPKAFFWSSGAWPSICPAGFTRHELSTAVRCPPAVQSLLMMTEPSPKAPDDSGRPADPLYRYLTSSTQLTHHPLPTTGVPVMLLSHAGHGEKAILECRRCAETLVDYLGELKIGEEINPGEVLILTADRKPLHRGFLSSDFVQGLVDSGLPIDIVQDYPGSQEKLAFPRNKITLTSFLFVCGLERKVVVFLPEGTAADNVPHTTGRAHYKDNQTDARTPHGEVPAPSWKTDAEVDQQAAEPAMPVWTSDGGTRHLKEEVSQTNRTSVCGTVTEESGMGTGETEMHPGKHEKLDDVQPAASGGRREEHDSRVDRKEAGDRSSVEAENDNIPEVYDGHLDGVGRVGRREASQKKTEENREDPCLESREGKRREASTENREVNRQEASAENREENGQEASTKNRGENRQEASTENREENRQEASTENREENRQEASTENREENRQEESTENREENKQEASTKNRRGNRQEASTENREKNRQEAFQKNGEEDRRKDVFQDDKGTELSADDALLMPSRCNREYISGSEKRTQLNSPFRRHDITNTEISEEDSGSDCDTIASIGNPSSGYESDDEQSSASEELSVKMGMPPFGVDSRFTEMRREQHPCAGVKADDSATKDSNTDIFSDNGSFPSAPCSVNDAHDNRQETVHDDAYFSRHEASEKEEKDDAKSSEERDDSRNPSGPDAPQPESPDQSFVVTNQPDGDLQSQEHATTATNGRGQKPVDVQSLNSRLQAAVESMSSTNKEVMWFSVSRALGHAVVFHF